ncbi:MAG: hypothetical protein IT449_07705 [Phycisphaerales bacterium]|nr:hypothetical protein [Phycisphaerales bacterium]
MAPDMTTLIAAAQAQMDRQVEELAEQEAQALRAVVAKQATGNGSISHTFKLDRKFRLVYVRCHFSSGLGTAAMKISVSSASGSAYNTLLQTITGVGVGTDVNQRMDALTEPSPWTFQQGDSVKVEWTNPGTTSWGLEVGLALAS